LCVQCVRERESGRERAPETDREGERQREKARGRAGKWEAGLGAARSRTVLHRGERAADRDRQREEGHPTQGQMLHV
jgi:hypothetical protein